MNWTNTEINIAIAEACGWLPPKCDRIGGCLKETGAKDGFDWHCKCDDNVLECPSYTTDLNAMHEAEKTLNVNDKWVMWSIIGDIRDKQCEGNCKEPTTFATAHQRAEAFLRTLGKWKD